MKLFSRFLCICIGYFSGSILTAELVARKMTGRSARQLGSGNPGMTNIMLHLGKKAGFLVLAGDMAKTLSALFLSFRCFGGQIGRASLLWGGLGTILGHNFSAFSHLKGGKGVAVTCTWLIICMPLWGTLCCLSGGLVCLITGYLPLGAVLIPFLSIIPGFLQGKESGFSMTAASLMMFFRHRNGLKRMLYGQEKRFFH